MNICNLKQFPASLYFHYKRFIYFSRTVGDLTWQSYFPTCCRDVIMIYENLSNHQTLSRNPGKNNEILKWRKYLSSNVNTTHQSLDTDKEKKDCLLLFPLASYLQELLQPWMFLCLCVPRRLRLPCVRSRAAFTAHRWQQCCTVLLKLLL